MSIAVNVNDPTNTGVNSTSSATGSSSLTGSNASDLQSSFLTLLVAQAENRGPDQSDAEQRTDHAACADQYRQRH